MRKKYDTDEDLQRVNLALNLTQDQPEKFRLAVKSLEFHDKMAFLMFFEEVALLNNSGILNIDVIFYTFSWDALLAYETDEFWDDALKKDDPYWALFKSFCERMILYRAKYMKGHWPVSDLRV